MPSVDLLTRARTPMFATGSAGRVARRRANSSAVGAARSGRQRASGVGGGGGAVFHAGTENVSMLFGSSGVRTGPLCRAFASASSGGQNGSDSFTDPASHRLGGL